MEVISVLARENIKGTCEYCNEDVYKVAFVKDKKEYKYSCLDCIGEGESEREEEEVKVEKIDEEKMNRENMLGILLDLAKEDEERIKDPRLTVIHKFKEEIVDGDISPQLRKYIKFNENPIDWIMKIRTLAFEATKHEGEKYREVTDLYIESRVRRLDEEKENRLKIILADRDIQKLSEDYKSVWENYVDIYEEIMKDYSRKRYDHLDDMRKIIWFIERKGYATDLQIRRLNSFYNEMLRRNKV